MPVIFGFMQLHWGSSVSYTHIDVYKRQVETYFNATSGTYGLVELNERYKDIRLPHIALVDIKELAHQKRMQGPCLLYTSICFRNFIYRSSPLP